MPAPVSISTHPLIQHKLARLRAILTAERLKRVLKPNLEGFVAELLADLRKIG